MKTAAKVFIWIGMICQFMFIFPLIVGILALNKIKEAKRKEDLTILGILTLFFCSFLGGIFMLCIKDEDLVSTSSSENGQNYTYTNNQNTQYYNDQREFVSQTKEFSNEQSKTSAAMDKLIKLSKMREENLISEEEFKSLKQEVLKDI